MSVNVNGKGVKSLGGRTFWSTASVVIAIIAIWLFASLILTILFWSAIILAGLTVLHVVLRVMGRRGIYSRENGAHTWSTIGAFGRR